MRLSCSECDAAASHICLRAQNSAYVGDVPLVPIVLAFVALFGFVALALPLALVQRYRSGTARRLARGWVAAVNFAMTTVSAVLFLAVAAFANFWVREAFRFSLMGCAAGLLVGVLGLLVTRWEGTIRGLHYTPNRWLVLLVVSAVSARLLYGFWRAWNAWQSHDGDESWLAAAGIPGSMAVGAGVIGYYVAYWAGLWWQVRRHRSRFRGWSAAA
jgi:hypothetical protein